MAPHHPHPALAPQLAQVREEEQDSRSMVAPPSMVAPTPKYAGTDALADVVRRMNDPVQRELGFWRRTDIS